MCGTPKTDGSAGEFTVALPGMSLGIDDKTDFSWTVEAPDVARADTITLPNGCSIYAFLISGWSDNDGYDQIIFYKLAEYVAQHNGYVHVGWWNNLGKEYMERPLHQEQIRVTQKYPFLPDIELPPINATPGTDIKDAFLIDSVDLPKANPDEDFQFVSDLRVVLRKIRDNNPNAIIILAGHSMGGKAIVNAVAGTDISVDLLAAIDPVGNRDLPFFSVGLKQNWTRWRATHDLKGWKVRDCVRVNEPGGTGVCANFGTFFFPQVLCTTRGPWLLIKPGPLAGSLQPLFCPGPVEDPGTQTIGRNIKRLYYRWQTEFLPPVDYEATQLFTRPDFERSTNDKLSQNLQAEFVTCSGGGYDPMDDRYKCLSLDGHRELIGTREKSDLNDDEEEVPDDKGQVRPGQKLRDWPARSSTFTPGQRRERLIQLAVDGEDWPYRPKNPDLCVVCLDLVDITALLWGELPVSGTGEVPPDTLPPSSSATANPEANTQGWSNENVVVSVGATDNRSVQDIHVTLSGAQSGVITTPGTSAEAVITAEGLTTVSYFARDVAGNEEPPNTLEIRIDKTAPEVNAVVDILPNAHGWIGRPIVISFVTSDEVGGSGIASSTPDIPVSTEGANQEVPGPAEDNAGNIGSAVATLDIDLTPPEIAFDSPVPSANAAGWNNSPVTVSWNCTDALSGPVAAFDSVTVGSDGAAQSATGTCRDLADHVTTGTLAGLNIDTTPPEIVAVADIAPNSNGWNNGDVHVTFVASDVLSGLALTPPVRLVSSEGAGQDIGGTAEDNAGNAASASVVLNIDKTAPMIALTSRTPAANGAGWNNTDVSLLWNCSDALSGPVVDQVSQSVSAEGAATNVIANCDDHAGNNASDARSVSIDKTSPTSLIITPAEGAAYLVNAVVNAAYSCADALSGVSACAGPVSPGAGIDTATVGAKTFTVNAADAAGNQFASSRAYAVQYAFSGFSNPIAAMPAINSATAGRTVLVKYSLRDASGVVLSNLASFVSLASAPVSCDTNVPTAAAEESDAAGSTGIRFELDKFIFNWKTSAAWQGTCRVLQLTLSDGTEHMVAFKFK
jgi:pimeloyl-ACP methyl ester carboxylesterase